MNAQTKSIPVANGFFYIHPQAVVSPKASIGKGTKIWPFAQIREHAHVGQDCTIGNGVYIDTLVHVGNRVAIHNKALLYRKLIVEDDVFIGPGVIFVNDKNPRSGNTRALENTSWTVKQGASIGAASIIMPDITIGAHALIGAGSVVTKDVPDHALVYGSPARIQGYVCSCGVRLPELDTSKVICQKCLEKSNNRASTRPPNAQRSQVIPPVQDSQRRKNLQSAITWLCQSGIQNQSNEVKFHGGFHAWLNIHKEYPFIYSEITGYGITTLLFLAEQNIDKTIDYIKLAQDAADWLLGQALHPCGGVRTRYYLSTKYTQPHYSFAQENLFTFDTGMALFGIAKLYEITRHEPYQQAAIKMANFLCGMQRIDGSFYAYYNPVTQQYGDESDKWSNQSGSYHSKVAMGLLATYAITQDQKYCQAARVACKYALKQQEETGRFKTSRLDGSTHQHPHSYAAEGLLHCGLALQEPSFVAAARKAVIWSFMHQAQDGGIPQIYDSKNGTFIQHQRSDILAQVLRLGLLINHVEKSPVIPESKLRQLEAKLATHQCMDNEPACHGGTVYGVEKDGTKHQDLNSWCSMFAVQGYAYSQKYYQHQDIDSKFLV